MRCLSTGALLRAHQLHTFSLHQHKQTLDDWNRAFRIALERRIPRQHGLFLGLSSGVDSGLIALRLAVVLGRGDYASALSEPLAAALLDAPDCGAAVQAYLQEHTDATEKAAAAEAVSWLGACCMCCQMECPILCGAQRFGRI